MRIICPNCDYSQDIPEEKIPPRSVMATCPKCGEKFRFRDPDPALLAELREQQDAGREAASGEPAQEPPREQDADGSETAAQTPPTEPEQPRTRPAAPPLIAESGPERERPAGEADDAQAGRGADQGSDIWQRLEGLAGDEGPPRAEEAGPEPGPGAAFGPGDDDRVPPPWERLDEYGFFPGLASTVKLTMFHPRIFFSAMSRTGGLGKPLVFYLLVSEFAAVCQFIWQMLGMDLVMRLADQGVTPEQTVLTGAGVLASLVVYPLLLAGGVFVSTAIVHLLLMLLRAGEAGFEGTFRVVAYSAAPIVLAVFPFVGSLIGALWSLFIFLIGLRWVHRAPYWRIIVALHIPVFALIALAIVLGAVARMQGAV